MRSHLLLSLAGRKAERVRRCCKNAPFDGNMAIVSRRVLGLEVA